MRTTIDIPEPLLREARERAARRGSTLGQIVEEALQASFLSIDATAEEEPVQLPTYGVGGVLPGVDLDDSAVLLDLMERAD
jgi:hypothetical protein